MCSAAAGARVASLDAGGLWPGWVVDICMSSVVLNPLVSNVHFMLVSNYIITMVLLMIISPKRRLGCMCVVLFFFRTAEESGAQHTIRLVYGEPNKEHRSRKLLLGTYEF